MTLIEKSARVLQRALTKHFGCDPHAEDDEAEIYIHRNRIEMTNERCTIVARGPVHVATILRRKRRKK